MKTILIIGAGFSGVIVAVQLLRQQHKTPLKIVLLNGGGRVARGMAYGTQSPEHTLNVPAGNMSALEDDADHFLRFARSRDSEVEADSFVSRQLYGDYLEWLLEQAELCVAGDATLERVFQFVTALCRSEDGGAMVAQLDDGTSIVADNVVLALGHFPSNNLPLVDGAAFYSQRYHRDPWDVDRIALIPSDAPVLLLGTGLTMVDTATTLLKRSPTRKIMAVSRRGLLPQAHRPGAHHRAGDGGAHAIWGKASTVREQLRAFRHYSRALAQEGRDWRDAMALLRPATADIWMGYAEKERRRFIGHVQPYWDTHRHRLAPALHRQLDAARQAGLVQTSAARVMGFRENTTGIEVTLRPRGAARSIVVQAGAVINCTGPCANPRQTGNALVEQLLRDGLIRTDTLGLGLDVGSDCAAINQHGQRSTSLFYIGPWLKAAYWEATAVPDLRRFASALAQRLSAPG